MSEINLNSDDKHPVIRIGNEVHRPTSWWTPSVHNLLEHLETIGFKYAPRVLGFDEQGREVLTYIEGESGKASWAKVISETGLRSFAKLLNDYHDAVASYRPADNSRWAYAAGGLKPGEIICHGDFGPWNIVWQGNEPVGILDWDFVLPAKLEYDILYAIEWSAPIHNDEMCLEWHHFPQVPDRKSRIKVFLDAYGVSGMDNIAEKIANIQRQGAKHVAYLAKRGIQPQADWVVGGELNKIENWAQWTESNKHLLE